MGIYIRADTELGVPFHREMRSLALLAIVGHCREFVDIRCDCDICSPGPDPLVKACGVDVIIAMESTDRDQWDAMTPWTNKLLATFDARQNVAKAVATFGNYTNMFDFDTGFDGDAGFVGGDANYDALVNGVINQFTQRAHNNLYKVLVMMTNGNGISEDDTRRLSKLLFQNDLVDLIIPVMISQTCLESTETAHCPNMANLALWSNPDGTSTTMAHSIQSAGAIRSIDKELADLSQLNTNVCKTSHFDIKYDMTILVDGSDSIHRRDWQHEIKPALKNWIKSYPNSLVTVKQFSRKSRTELGPLVPANEKGWSTKIDRMEQMASSTYFNRALEDIASAEFEQIRESALHQMGETLENRFRLLLVVSDGWPDNEAHQPPPLDMYDLMIIVGVGSDRHVEWLDKLSSKQRAMVELAEVKNYGELRLRLSQVKKQVAVRLRSMLAIRNRSKRRTDLLNVSHAAMPNFSSECINGMCNCRCFAPVLTVSTNTAHGIPGQDGRDGERGEAGRDGQRGEAGRRGERGERGDMGDPGADGPSGSNGAAGMTGKSGSTGQPGNKGAKGQPGKAIDAQLDGVNGDDGDVGPAGENGRAGLDGRDGDPGPVGRPGIDGIDGAAGDRGMDGVDGIDGVATVGVCGPIGETGLDGADGRDGEDGFDGRDGQPGPVGAPGEIGQKGDRGANGRVGDAGDEGDSGAHGEHGKPGSNGPAGHVGDSGQNGHRGLQGIKGPRGADGADGEHGEKGLPGLDGLLGAIGLPGLPGIGGDPGEIGDNGIDGDDGPAGGPGDFGEPGDKGAKGRRGMAGLPGVVDLDQHYVQIKSWVKERMIKNGWKCERCKSEPTVAPSTTTSTTTTTTTTTTISTTPSTLYPMNLVVLLDGSDSIRSSKKEEKNEWGQALAKVGDFIDAFKLGQRNPNQPDYLSFVQYSREVNGHLLGVPINSLESRNQYKATIAATEQMKQTTNTYLALDFVSRIYEHFNTTTTTVPFDLVNVLVVITDGEARDDRDQVRINAILEQVADYYDFVVPIGVGPNYNERELARIRGKHVTRPVTTPTFGELVPAATLIESKIENEIVSPGSLRRKKRHLRRRINSLL